MLIFEFSSSASLVFLYFEFNKLKIQIVVTLVFDISIFNDVKSVCACEFFVCGCVFMSKFVLDEERFFMEDEK